MLCGLPRLSPRSLTSTAIFFSTAVLTRTFVPLIHTPLPECPDPSSLLSCFTPTAPPSNTALGIYAALALAAYATNTLIQTSFRRTPRNRAVSAFYSGGVFALGLILSGLHDPRKVAGFLSVFRGNGTFDPSLLLVMLFALAPNAYVWQRELREREVKRKVAEEVCGEDAGRRKGEIEAACGPALDNKWSTPTRMDVDARLLGGSVLFVVGWGLYGVCPGPGVISAVAGLVGRKAWSQGLWWLVGFWGGRWGAGWF